MGFITPLLLGGIALVAIPVALHLIMRQQPRELTFPALRFVKQQRESNRRKLKLRHWLLLALRCLLIAGIAAALARPTLKGTGLKGKEGAPLAVSLVIDNSLRMQYINQNQTRLEQATAEALDLVEKLPEEAMVAVCDLGRAANGFSPDLSAAASRLRNLRATAEARPLADIVLESIRLVAEQEDRRQETFVFTDLSQEAWNEEAISKINAALTESPDVRIYIVDCGVAEPKNSSVGELQVRRSVLRPGEPLYIEAELTSNLTDEPLLAELLLQDDDGKPRKRDQRIASVDESGHGRVAFEVADLPLGTHQGSVQLATTDPLAVDNVRYFTVEVRPPAKVLLLAERRADAQFMQNALGASLGIGSRFECEVKTFAELEKTTLDEFQAVALLDPGPLPNEGWNQLWDFASTGGGVGIFLGHNAVGELESFNGDAVQRLLPGKLKRVSHEATYLRPRRLDHPSLVGLRSYAEGIPWQICRVFSYWQFEQLGIESYVIAAYANEQPAIVERPAGRGRALTTTTPFSDPLEPEGREPWNVLPSEPWPFVALCDHLIGYLVQDGDERFDYLAGESARVRLTPQQQVANYVLRMPDGQAGTRVAITGGDELTVSATDVLGNYRLSAGGKSQRLDRGFSVNAAAQLNDLSRINPETLTAELPKDRVRLAENMETAEKYVNIGRSGRELFPWVIGLVAIIWGAEHLLANRFYRETKSD